MRLPALPMPHLHWPDFHLPGGTPLGNSLVILGMLGGAVGQFVERNRPEVGFSVSVLVACVGLYINWTNSRSLRKVHRAQIAAYERARSLADLDGPAGAK